MAQYTETTRPADDEARNQARRILAASQHAALAYAEISTAAPGIARISLALTPWGEPISLVSGLARHTAGLRANPDCAFMVGDPGARGDPLIHPRLMVKARADFVAREGEDHAALRLHWLSRHPKAKLYIDFADFAFVRLVPVSALLNAGFGKAFRMEPGDLVPPGTARAAP